MKEGLTLGETTRLEITVTSDMFAVFDDELVHAAYSTASMVKHMEQVSRMLLLPYLEEDEESAGGKVSMTHIAPTPEHSKVIHTATLIVMSDKKIVTEVVAENALGIIGKGTVTIALLEKGFMANTLKTIQQSINHKEKK